MMKFDLNNKEGRKTLILDFVSRFLSRYPDFNKEILKNKLLDLLIINDTLECPYYIESIPVLNVIVIDHERLGETSDEGIIFLHQLIRILSGNINELNDGIIEQILSKLYPKENFYNFLDEKVVASLLENIFGEEELLNSLFDNNYNLEVLATQKLNSKDFIKLLKEKMAANSEDIRYADPGNPLSSLVDIITFIFNAYINGDNASISDLEVFEEIVKEWRTEVMMDEEKYPENDIYPGVEGILDYMTVKIEEKIKNQL